MTISKHCDTVSQTPHLLHTVGDVNQPCAFATQFLHDVEQALGLASRQRSRWFIQDEDLCPTRYSLGNLHHLLFASTQLTKRDIRINVCTDDAELAKSILTHLFLVDKP